MPPWDDIPLGVHAAVNVGHPDPMFETKTRAKLISTDVYAPIASFVFEAFEAYLKSDKPDYDRWKALIQESNQD